MRVGLFTNNYLPFRGGVTTAVETLRRGLEALGHGVGVFAPAWSGPHVDPAYVFRYPSAPAPTYPGFAIPLPFSRRLSRAARELELDVFHAQHPFLLGVTAPIATVPTGVPLDLFCPGDRLEARRALGLPEDLPLCLYVGRLDREKSVERVIDAFGSIAGAVSGVRLLLVGQGSQ